MVEILVLGEVSGDGLDHSFKGAASGVVGHWRKGLPTFIETVRELVK
jgi:hypothetical protein